MPWGRVMRLTLGGPLVAARRRGPVPGPSSCPNSHEAGFFRLPARRGFVPTPAGLGFVRIPGRPWFGQISSPAGPFRMPARLGFARSCLRWRGPGLFESGRRSHPSIGFARISLLRGRSDSGVARVGPLHEPARPGWHCRRAVTSARTSAPGRLGRGRARRRCRLLGLERLQRAQRADELARRGAAMAQQGLEPTWCRSSGSTRGPRISVRPGPASPSPEHFDLKRLGPGEPPGRARDAPSRMLWIAPSGASSSVSAASRASKSATSSSGSTMYFCARRPCFSEFCAERALLSGVVGPRDFARRSCGWPAPGSPAPTSVGTVWSGARGR